MNEQEWLTCRSPNRLLHYLEHLPTSPFSERKIRLFACACCRRIWNLMPDESHRRAVEVAERFVDGLADPAELNEARLAVWQFIQRGAVLGRTNASSWAVLRTAGEVVGGYWVSIAADAATANGGERPAQAALLRDLLGNPFRPAAVAPAWLTWNGGAVRQMARVIYEESRFAELPFLGDALEDAGCTDPALLRHCREPGVHVRGCWVVDQLTGKE